MVKHIIMKLQRNWTL